MRPPRKEREAECEIEWDVAIISKCQQVTASLVCAVRQLQTENDEKDAKFIDARTDDRYQFSCIEDIIVGEHPLDQIKSSETVGTLEDILKKVPLNTWHHVIQLDKKDISARDTLSQ